jgi:hypothetical protein
VIVFDSGIGIGIALSIPANERSKTPRLIMTPNL